MSTAQSFHQTADQIAHEEDILRAAMKNPNAFAPIYEKYYLPIFKYVIQRTENETVAAEVVSNVFAKALFNLKKYQFKGLPFSAWLYRVAFNAITDYHRSNKKQNRIVNVPLEGIEFIEEEDKEENKTHLRNQMMSCLKDLKPQELELIEMRFFENRPFKEIGEILNMTTEHARVKTHRALGKLKKLMLK